MKVEKGRVRVIDVGESGSCVVVDHTHNLEGVGDM
jgi:hypothetical protein